MRAQSLFASLLLSSAVVQAGTIVPAEVTLTPVITGVTRPIAMRDAGNGRFYVVQQNGVIRIADNLVLQPTPLLTLGNATTQCQMAPAASTVTLGFTNPSGLGDERGLLGFDLHPDYASNGYVFVSFSDARGDTAVVRYTVSGGVATPASCRIVLRIDQDFSNHNGGDIHFGPDGYLYVGMGDGGSANDPCNRAQTLDPANLPASDGVSGCAADTNFVNLGDGNAQSRALLGKFLRLDVNNTTPAGANELCADYSDGSAGYAIPTAPGDANPFAGTNGGAGICDESWSYGWRNPWRWSFDRSTGDLLVGDVGQGSREEVDLEPAADPGAGNYGWRGCEGNIAANGGSCAGTEPPILVYSHTSSRCSIAGGYRYRGDFSAMGGVYFYGDSCTGEIFAAAESMGTWSNELWQDASSQPSSYSLVSFAEDRAGRIYAIDHAAAITDAGRILEIRTPIQVLFANGFED
jgi:glucose/arabinose dehydrogenase